MKSIIIIMLSLIAATSFGSVNRDNLKKEISNSIFNNNLLPSELLVDGDNLKINYCIDKKLQAYVRKLLLRYRSDYAAVVVIDNNTGNILSMIGTERTGNKINMSIPLSSTHPAASVFKIITAANLIGKSDLTLDDKIKYRGRGKTLYKYQLEDKKSKWNKHTSLKKAFTYSNNVVFGKATLENSNALSLFKTSFNFGFNKDLMEDIELPMSVIKMPETEYQLAELASGFNVDTMISPIHAALISSIIANDGNEMKLHLIESIFEEGKSENLYNDKDPEMTKVIDSESATQLKNMMKSVVSRGTARQVRFNVKKSILSNLEIGGKTGTITGGTPFGKRDWFTSFVIPKNNKDDSGISISVMNINKDKWYIKSTELAGKIINYFYKNRI